MGTITTIIHVGSGHPYHGGIIPEHVLYLSENDRPVWILTEYLPKEASQVYRMVPHSPKYILEDAFTFIGWVVMKNPLFNEYFHGDPRPRSLMHFPNEQDPDHSVASGLIRQVFGRGGPMIAISFIEQQKIPQQAAFIKDLPVQVCLLTAAYSRTRSSGENKMVETGNFE